jgi:hypothetical protein
MVLDDAAQPTGDGWRPGSRVPPAPPASSPAAVIGGERGHARPAGHGSGKIIVTVPGRAPFSG